MTWWAIHLPCAPHPSCTAGPPSPAQECLFMERHESTSSLLRHPRSRGPPVSRINSETALCANSVALINPTVLPPCPIMSTLTCNRPLATRPAVAVRRPSRSALLVEAKHRKSSPKQPRSSNRCGSAGWVGRSGNAPHVPQTQSARRRPRRRELSSLICCRCRGEGESAALSQEDQQRVMQQRLGAQPASSTVRRGAPALVGRWCRGGGAPLQRWPGIVLGCDGVSGSRRQLTRWLPLLRPPSTGLQTQTRQPPLLRALPWIFGNRCCALPWAVTHSHPWPGGAAGTRKGHPAGLPHTCRLLTLPPNLPPAAHSAAQLAAGGGGAGAAGDGRLGGAAAGTAGQEPGEHGGG